MRKAVVLLSGGLDSATCLYWCIQKGLKPLCLLFDYGQKHRKEIQSAVRLCKKTGSPCEIVKFSLPWGGSALVDKGASLPQGRNLRQIASGIPPTYVPARNTIFLSFALSYADTIGAGSIVIGANAVDFSGYPDCRPSYMEAMRKVAHLGTKSGAEGKKIKILSPLIKMSKAEIIRLGLKLKVPYELTWSCYRGGSKPCGRCDSCILREKGFRKAGRAEHFS